MARVKIKMNSSGMASLLNSAEVRRDLTARMERVEASAQMNAPFESGDYSRSIHIVQDTTDRVAVRLVTDVDYGLVIEARTGNLSKALDAAGGS